VALGAEVPVVAPGEPGVAGLPDRIAARDLGAFLDAGLAQVPVEGEETEPVIDDDRVAVDAEGADEDDVPGVGSGYDGVLQRRDVVSEMRLVIDDGAVGRVGPAVRETRKG